MPTTRQSPVPELGSELWSSHPDALVVVDAGSVVDANPTTEELFGYAHSWLIGKPTDVLLPSRHVLRTADQSPLYRARRHNGHSFIASASLVPLRPSPKWDLLVIRDVTAIVKWMGLDLEGETERLEALDARERALEAGRETLVQYLFGAGIALRACAGTGTTEVSRERLERAIEVLEQVMTDLNQGA